MKITIFGAGYVGLVTGTCLADKGHKVIVIDIDEKRIEQLNQGKSPIYEPGLSELIKHNLKEERLEFSLDAKKGVEHANAIFIAVGTPQDEDGRANMNYFYEAAEEIAKHAKDGQVIIDKSTVAVGTAKRVEEIMKQAGKKVHVVSNPETLKEGSAIGDFVSPDRIIIGAKSEEAFKIMREVYSPFLIREDAGRLIEVNPESAELIKYGSNAMLAMKISFINFLSQFSVAMGADIMDVRKGIGTDKRIGMQFLYPGPGFGGSCFPKDVSALAFQARAQGVEPLLLDSALKTNENQKAYVTRLVVDALGAKNNIAIWGLAFKAKTDDIRESSSIYLAKNLLQLGKNISVHDPEAVENFTKAVKGVKSGKKSEILKEADVLVIMTEWDDYRTLSEEELKLLSGKTIVDGRNILNRATEKEKMKKNNIRYIGIGIPQNN